MMACLLYYKSKLVLCGADELHMRVIEIRTKMFATVSTESQEYRISHSCAYDNKHLSKVCIYISTQVSFNWGDVFFMQDRDSKTFKYCINCVGVDKIQAISFTGHLRFFFTSHSQIC